MIYTIEFHDVSISEIFIKADWEQQKNIFENGKNAKCIVDIVAKIEKENRLYFFAMCSKNASFQYLDQDTFEISFIGDYTEKELISFLMSLPKKQIISFCLDNSGLQKEIEAKRKQDFEKVAFRFGSLSVIGKDKKYFSVGKVEHFIRGSDKVAFLKECNFSEDIILQISENYSPKKALFEQMYFFNEGNYNYAD